MFKRKLQKRHLHRRYLDRVQKSTMWKATCTKIILSTTKESEYHGSKANNLKKSDCNKNQNTEINIYK